MKASILYLLFAFTLAPISGTLFAQEAGNRVYLFDSFKPATVKMKNGSKASPLLITMGANGKWFTMIRSN